MPHVFSRCGESPRVAERASHDLFQIMYDILPTSNNFDIFQRIYTQSGFPKFPKLILIDKSDHQQHHLGTLLFFFLDNYSRIPPIQNHGKILMILFGSVNRNLKCMIIFQDHKARSLKQGARCAPCSHTFSFIYIVANHIVDFSSIGREPITFK